MGMRFAMKKRWLFLSLWLVLCLAATAAEIKVMTWNIARAVGANSPITAKQPFVAKIVNHMNPDVWIIHELGGNTQGWNVTNQRNALIAFVNANLTIFGPSPQVNRDYYIYVNGRSDGYISTAVISRYPFLSTTDVNMGSPNRGLLIAKLNVPGTNGVGIFGAHFKAGGTNSDAQARQTNAENTRREMLKWQRANPLSAFFLGGDFNENEDPDLSSIFQINGTLPDGRNYIPLTTLRSARLRDTMPFDSLGGKRTYKISSRASDLDNRYDQLFVSANGDRRDNTRVVKGIIFNTRRFPVNGLPPGFEISDSENASDHAPLMAIVEITPSRRTR